MKNRIVISLILSLFLVVFSLASVSFGKEHSKNKGQSESANAAFVSASKEYKKEEEAENVPNEIKVLKASTNSVETMSVYNFVCGCVGADISPTYKEEAIKAQAVIAYTYVIWSLKNAD